jgi:hypothetical protein
MAEDAFDFYPCLVDKAFASIYVNLRYVDDERPAVADTRFSVVFEINAPGPHGIGTAAEGEALDAIEQTLMAQLGAHGLVYAGRVRTRGEWEVVFYGPASAAGVVRQSAEAAGRDHKIRSEADPGWRYYLELLVPDAERVRWMDDRRLVQVLAEQGDRLQVPRAVEHKLEFPSAATRDAFVTDAQRDGFHLVTTVENDHVHVAHVERTDAIELDQIHDVVMILVDAAHRHGGTYVGWTAGITR